MSDTPRSPRQFTDEHWAFIRQACHAALHRGLSATVVDLGDGIPLEIVLELDLTVTPGFVRCDREDAGSDLVRARYNTKRPDFLPGEPGELRPPTPPAEAVAGDDDEDDDADSLTLTSWTVSVPDKCVECTLPLVKGATAWSLRVGYHEHTLCTPCRNTFVGRIRGQAA